MHPSSINLYILIFASITLTNCANRTNNSSSTPARAARGEGIIVFTVDEYRQADTSTTITASVTEIKTQGFVSTRLSVGQSINITVQPNNELAAQLNKAYIEQSKITAMLMEKKPAPNHQEFSYKLLKIFSVK